MAAPGNGFGHQFFGAPAAVHLGGVDVGHAQIKAGAKGFDGPPLRLAAAFDHPGPLPDDRHLHTGPAEDAPDHGRWASAALGIRSPMVPATVTTSYLP